MSQQGHIALGKKGAAALFLLTILVVVVVFLVLARTKSEKAPTFPSSAVPGVVEMLCQGFHRVVALVVVVNEAAARIVVG